MTEKWPATFNVAIHGFWITAIPAEMTNCVDTYTNGAGKTSITEQLLRHDWMGGCVYVNPDYIARDDQKPRLKDGN